MLNKSKIMKTTSKGVSECLNIPSPPSTPPNMRKYRKKHNQMPGIKVIHHGLIDQKLPKGMIYGAKLSENNVQTAIPEVTKMFSEKHQTKLGKYIKEKDEINYRRHKLEPLGKTQDHGYILPDKILNDDKFAFGITSKKGEIGTKELIQINKDLKLPNTFSKMSITESIKAEKEIVSKRNYHYDWKSLRIDPNSFVFGKPPKKIDLDEDKRESVANSLKFAVNENENEKENERNNPMPQDFIYGLVKNKNLNNESVKECIHFQESQCIENKNDIKKINDGKILKDKFGNKEYIPSRINPKRISAKDLINPRKYSEIGIHREEYTKNRDFDDMIRIYNQCGFNIDHELKLRLKQILISKYENICSLNNLFEILSNLNKQ